MNELFNEYEAYCSEYRTVPVKKQEFNSQLEATYLFKKIRDNHGNVYIFHLSKVIEKLKKLGIYEEVLFLED